MTIPLWILLGFSVWTLLTLLGTVGVYRWSRILTGKASLVDFPADAGRGSGWYQRAMRAHANALESLPVLTAIVVVLVASGVGGPLIDALAIAILCGRVLQTITHVAFEQTNLVIGIRFVFFFIQIVAMLAIAGAIVVRT